MPGRTGNYNLAIPLGVRDCLSVCMYVYPSPLCDYIHGKENKVLTGAREDLSRLCLFSQLCEQTLLWYTKVQLRNHEKIFQDCSRPFCNWSFRESNQQPRFTIRGNHQIIFHKYPLLAVNLLLWLGAWRWTQEKLHFPSITSPTSEIFSKARLAYTCITG